MITEPLLVSIIIPCYNAERYVGEAVESALAQTYPRKEVVVIDDGSTDRSLEVIESFGDRIRWESGPNRGGGAARNCGLELADGGLIQFLDADDQLHAEKLERQVGPVTEDAKTLVFCDGELFDSNPLQQPNPYARRFDPSFDPVAYMLRGGLPTSAPLHWKTNLLAVGGFRAELPCAQERDLHLRLACSGLSFRHLPEVLFRVRRVAGSVSANSVRVLDQHSNLAWRAREMLEQSGRLTNARAAALAGFLAKDARAYLQHGHAEKSRDYFAQAALMHPQGGIPQAYSGRTRWLYRLLGPTVTQRLVGWKRQVTAGGV